MRFLESLEHIQQRKVIAIFQVVDFAEFHVVEAGGVFQQVYNAHRLGGFPPVFDGDFRCDVLQPGIEIDFSFFLQFQKRQRDKRFADRADAKFRVAAHFAAAGDVGFADSAAPEKLPIRHQRHSGSGDALFVEHVFHGFLQFLNGLRVRQIFFLLLCLAPGGRQSQHSSEK